MRAVAAATVVVVPHAAARQDRGQRGGMAERVRLEVHLHILRREVELLLEIAARVEQVAAEALAARHVLVALHPLAGGDFPPAFAHALPDLGEQRRVVFFDDGVGGGLILAEDEAGEFVQQREHRLERVVDHGDGLRPAPHPVHVDVGVADAEQCVGFGDVADGG